MSLKIQMKILDERIGTLFARPKFATTGSAGLDVCAMPTTSITLSPGDVTLIPTGVSLYIADPSIAATLLPRSGLGHKHGIILGNIIGLIDSDYQGPLMVSCWNRSVNPYVVNPGDRIAQLVFLPIIRPEFEIVEDFPYSERGEGGFGSTGQKAWVNAE